MFWCFILFIAVTIHSERALQQRFAQVDRAEQSLNVSVKIIQLKHLRCAYGLGFMKFHL